MDRVSDWRLKELIDFFSEPGVVQRERYENDTLDALTELRERRAAEKAPCPEHAKMMAEPAQWADFQCPKCGSYYVAHDRFGFRCVAVDCGWTKDTPI